MPVREFFKKKFLSKRKEPIKDVYVHFTQATDVGLMATVLKDVMGVIMANFVKSIGVL